MPGERPASITLRDVARAAGVSVASASRAQSRPEIVSADLLSRIGAAADRLGYVPNVAARKLAGKRSGIVGMLVRTLCDPLTAAATAAIDRQLGLAGHGLAVATYEDAADALVRARQLIGRGVDALVAWDPVEPLHELIAWAASHRVSWLALSAGGESRRDADAVGRRRGATLACRYLQSLGHVRFAAIEARARGVTAGFRDALGRTVRQQLIEAGELASEGAELQAALAWMLDRREAPTAVVCGSDLQALALLRACQAQGVAVPSQLSVLGFGDSEAGRHSWPALTTLRVSVEELAAQARDAIALALAGQDSAPIEAQVKLVIRESTAPAPL
jgi:LacI family transcriptional regulator